jgi:hypothetical protein
VGRFPRPAGDSDLMRAAFFLLAALIALSCPRSAAAASVPGIGLTILHVNDFHGRLEPAKPKPGIDNVPTGGAALLAGRGSGGSGRRTPGRDRSSSPPATCSRGPRPPTCPRRPGPRDHETPCPSTPWRSETTEFELGLDVLRKLRSGASFPFLSATVTGNAGRLLPGILPYVLLERKGIRIAVVGVSTPDTPYTTKRDNVEGLVFLGSVSALPEVVREAAVEGGRAVGRRPFHLRVRGGPEAGRGVPGIDVIVGGHTHTAVDEAVRSAGPWWPRPAPTGCTSASCASRRTRRPGRSPMPNPAAASSGPGGARAPEDPVTARIVGSYRARLRGNSAGWSESRTWTSCGTTTTSPTWGTFCAMRRGPRRGRTSPS